MGLPSAEGVWDTYIYEKNLQGDIVGVYNTSGTKLITYKYDAWGNMAVSYTNNGDNTNAAKNRLTYRGYYYDKELQMYYLKSRYYDASICRFVSPDKSDVVTVTPDALTDKNLYAYCDNNPVMRVDHSGELYNIAIGAAAGFAVGFISGIFSQILDPESPSITSAEFWVHVGVSAAFGTISGALAASSAGILGQVVVNASLGARAAIIDTFISDIFNGEKFDPAKYALKALEGGAIGALSGFIGGSGSASKNVVNSFWRSGAKGFSNFSYYISQVRTQSIRDGLKAIPSIIKSSIPNLLKSALKAMGG